MLLLIDNYDSFTYNLVHALHYCGAKVTLLRNSAKLEECLNIKPKAIVLGPGPGTPLSSGITLPLLKVAAEKKIPTLGVCLGHQALAAYYGGSVARAKKPMHGKISPMFHSTYGLFKNIEQPFLATRYHSLIVLKENFPSCLSITAETHEGEIMAIEHKSLPLYGVQFHPESIMTKSGLQLLYNFLSFA